MQAKIGLVAHGSNTATLLRAFATALKVLRDTPDEHEYEIGEAEAVASFLDQGMGYYDEYALSILTACFVALDTHSPLDHYFGVRKGSDNEFGFWPIPLVEDDR